MKRWVGVLLGISVLLMGWSTFRSVEASGGRCGLLEHRVTVIARGGEGRAFVSVDDLGEIPFMDPATGETIAPLRQLFTILSSQGGVSWDEGSRTARFSYADHHLSIQVPSQGGGVRTLLDGTPYPLRAYLCEGRLHAPLRGVTEALGLEVRWYHSQRTAVVDPVWTTGVHGPAEQPTLAGGPKRPASCSAIAQVGWSDLLAHPLEAWDRTVKRTACGLII